MHEVLEFAERSRLASTVGELNLAFSKLATGWGFTSFTAIQISERSNRLRRPLERSFGIGIGTWGVHYRESGHLRHDPLIGKLMTGNTGFWWSEGEREASEKRQKVIFDEARDYGWKHGLAIPVRLADGSLWSCALASDQLDEREEVRLAASAVAGLFINHGAILLAAEERTLSNDHVLTPRQRDVVRWLARGLNAGEVGEVLGTSERTVSHHIEAAKTRLGAKTQAGLVMEAVLAGEVQLSEISSSREMNHK